MLILPPLPPSVPHNTYPSESKNHMHNLPVGFAYGPVVQRPGSHRCPFNMSNGPFHQSIVVVVEPKTAPVALLPLAPQISHLIDSLSSLIMVESFCLLYEDLCLSTTSVYTPSDLSRVETFVCILIPEGSSVQCEVPSLCSICKLIGVPFLCSGNPINSKNASLILASSVTRTVFALLPHPGLFTILGGLTHAQYTSISETCRQAPR